MKLELVSTIAESLCHQMRPYVERIEIAGSIRRGCDEVGDIELVAIAKWEQRSVPGTLFSEATAPFNLLHEWAVNNPRISWRKTNAPDEPTTPKADGKHWKGMLLATGMKLDLFLCQRANWGTIFLIRTGSKDFSQACAMQAQRVRLRFDEGKLKRGDVWLETYEEADVFRLLQMDFVEPGARSTMWAAKRGAARYRAGIRRAVPPDDIEAAVEETLSRWNGDNDSPAAQIEARKEAARG